MEYSHPYFPQNVVAKGLMGEPREYPAVDVDGNRHIWVIIFKNDEDSVYEMEKEDQEMYRERRVEIVSGIGKLGIKVVKHFSRDKDEKIVKLYASQDTLETLAEKVNFKVKLKRGQHVPFKKAHRNLYAVPRLWNTANASLDDDKETEDYVESDTDFHFSSSDSATIIYNVLEMKTQLGGAGISLDHLLHTGHIEQFFPTHREEEVSWLKQHWGNFALIPSLFLNQPTERIRDYFGSSVALYFTFLGFYTKWLCAPALAGCYAFAVQMAEQNFDSDLVVPLFAFFMCFWGTLFLEFWKRREITCAFRWGTRGFEKEEKPRPEFEGEPRLNPITGEEEDYYPPEKRQVKFLTSLSVAILSTVVVGFGISSVLMFKYFLVSSLGAGASAIPGILNGIMIAVFNVLYEMLAEILTDWENHKTQTSYEDSLIIKTFLFQFMNSYCSFYLVAFVKPYGDYFGTKEAFGECKCITFNQFGCSDSNIIGPDTPSPPDGSAIDCSCLKYSCIDELSLLLICVFLVQLFIDNFVEWGVPYAKAKVAIYLEEKKMQEEAEQNKASAVATISAVVETETLELLCQAEHESKLGPYSVKDTFKDYNELVIQYGFVSLFSAAFPLCAFLALANNVIEIRSDAGKLLNVMQRPMAKSAEDLGSWFNIMDIMTYICVVTNCLLVWFTSSFSHDMNMGDRIWGFILSEHIIIFIKTALAYIIPDIPVKTLEAMEREEFRMKKQAEDIFLAGEDGVAAEEGGAEAGVAAGADDDIYDEEDLTDNPWMVPL